MSAALGLLALLDNRRACAGRCRSGCRNLPDSPYNYANVDPAAVTWPSCEPISPGTTRSRTTVPPSGRVLFYDKRLSVNNTTACATRATFRNTPFRTRSSSVPDFAGAKTPRNSMGLANGRFFQADQFFWDARVKNLEELILTADSEPHRDGQHAGSGRWPR